MAMFTAILDCCGSGQGPFSRDRCVSDFLYLCSTFVFLSQRFSSPVQFTFEASKFRSRLALKHLSPCVPSILRCFGPQHRYKICKELPKHFKLIIRSVPDGSLKIPAEHAQIPLLFGDSKRELASIRFARKCPELLRSNERVDEVSF